MTPGLALGAFLVGLLFLVISSKEQWDLSANHPLNVDERLPLPWVGFASTALSLSGLFGVYAAAAVLSGLACLSGALAGGIVGLVVIDCRTQPNNQNSFDGFLRSIRAAKDRSEHVVYWVALALCQLALCVSELLLFRFALIHGLGLTPSVATVTAFSVSLICYFYCLFAAYNAAYRTDVAQYLVLVVAAAILAVSRGDISIPEPTPAGLDSSTLLAPFYQLPAWLQTSVLFALGVPLGAIPVLGSPDTWKRVHVMKKRHRRATSRWLLIAAAGVPAAALVLLAVPDASLSSLEDFLPLRTLFVASSDLVRSTLLLGVTAVFMSTFDSALLSATHMLHTLEDVLHTPSADTPLMRYRLLLAGCLLLVVFVFAAMVSVSLPPYSVALFLMGPAAILAGLAGGTFLFHTPMVHRAVLTASTLAFATWIGLYRCALRPLLPLGFEPSIAVAVVAAGSVYFFAFMLIGRISTTRQPSGHA